MKKEKENKIMAKWVCTVCGYIYEGEQAPEKCPQCGVPASKFKKQEGVTPLQYRKARKEYAK